MSDLTLEQEMGYAQRRAAEVAAEIFYFDKAQPFYPRGFSIGYRNPGHWDIYADQVPGKASAWKAANPEGSTSATDGGQERAFRIRGKAPEVVIYDERWNPHRPHPREHLTFRSVSAALAWIGEELMAEPRPPGFEEAARAAADALKRFNGHDSHANLKYHYGEKWWEKVTQIETDLRAVLTG